MGSRYGGLKQVDPVGPDGEFILDYSVYDAFRAGFRKIVFVIRREMEAAFRETIARRLPREIEIALRLSGTRPCCRKAARFPKGERSLGAPDTPSGSRGTPSASRCS